MPIKKDWTTRHVPKPSAPKPPRHASESSGHPKPNLGDALLSTSDCADEGAALSAPGHIDTRALLELTLPAGDPRIDAWFLTATGRQVWPAFLNVEVVNIEDIGRALSKICRFGGHCREFYSVAQHSVLTMNIACHAWKLRNSAARAVLLHDAQEAYLGDVVSPLKAELREYQLLEHLAEQVMQAKFDLQISEDLRHIIKQSDLKALATERHYLLPDLGPPWPCLAGIEPLDEVLEPLAPKEAFELFMAAWADVA
jgi:uncharacterized protein